MKRETRINLLVIAIILAVMIPGGVRLAHLAYTEGRGPSASPTPARKAVAYMDPRPFDPSIPRVAPPATVAWLEGIAHRFAPPDTQPAAAQRSMSAHLRFELLRHVYADREQQFVVIIWHRAAEPVNFTLTADSRAHRCETLARDTLALPPRVRRELLAIGYETAPTAVTVMHLRATAPGLAAPAELQALHQGKVVDTIALR